MGRGKLTTPPSSKVPEHAKMKLLCGKYLDKLEQSMGRVIGGFIRIVVSKIEAPSLKVKLVYSVWTVVQSDNATEP